jgi:eukaryotic-like serine/threonine-protein kinase
MELVAQMRELGFWSPEDAAASRTVAELTRKFREPRQLARELVQREILTPYQANQLFTGKGRSLAIGRYLILDRIGEGGMGKVYKARHRTLHRVVALKVINPERLTNQQAVERFHREIQAVARLKHPNIVWAFDADQVGSVTYFAMQFVPGMDLGRLVKQSGPLDVARGCDYIRQAALGLQHIADNGMVHRDIKPSNLLVVNMANQPSNLESGVLATALKTDLVKIVDLGLTRLEETEDSGDQPLTTLTKDSILMGTPDYIAPEQARNSHAADIRSDIYSLGCTLYFAIAGRPPFGGTNAMQKIMQHQLDEAEPLDKVRPGIPPALALIVRRMMAKRPEERYQTPAEAAQALEPLARGQFAPVAAPVSVLPVTEDLKQTRSLFEFGNTEVEPLVVSSKSAPRLPNNSAQQWLWVWIASGAVAGLLLLILLIKLLIR